MKCCILSCKSYSDRHSNVADRITFHVFPTDEILKRKWIKAINRKDWTPTKFTKICSLHFNKRDFTMSGTRYRKLSSGATPCLNLGTQEIQGDVPQPSRKGQRELEKVCRICLAIDRKVWNIKRYNLKQSYEEIMGQKLNGSLPLSLCWECAHRLLSFAHFKTKVRNAHNLMMDLLHSNKNLTPQVIQTINRKRNNLESSLSIKIIDYDSTDFYFNDDNDNVTDMCDDVNDTKFEIDSNCDMNSNNFDEKSDTVVINMDDTDEAEGDDDDANERHSSSNYTAYIEPIELENETFIDQNLEDLDMKKENDANESSLDSNMEDSSSNDAVLIKKTTKDNETKTESVKEKKTESPEKGKSSLEPIDETIFTVVNMTYSESVREIQKRKESENYLYSVFKCSQCYKGFLDEDVYRVHCIRHTSRNGSFVCDICNLYFNHRRSWHNHALTHLYKFICKSCPYVTYRRTSAKLHEKFHKGKTYQCSQCGMKFGVKSTYLGHLRKKHPSDFVCEQCGYNFLSTKGLRLHKQLKHKFDEYTASENGAYCEVCDIYFATDIALSNHLLSSAKHAGDRENQDVTSTTSRSTQEMKKRTILYSRTKRKPTEPIYCEQCDMPMPDAGTYYRHFRKHHPDKNRTKFAVSEKTKVMCEVCGKIFQSKCHLRDHSSKHSGEGPFPCDQCGKTFARRFRLLTHLKLHGERRTYACPICDKEYSSVSNMQRHCFIHTGLKPHKCEMCGKCFKNTTEKKAHVKYVHLKKAWPKRIRRKRGEKQGQQKVQSSENIGASDTE